MRHQYEPFSPTITGRRGPLARRHLEAARLGDDVVGLHRVALVLERGARRPTCRGSPRRRPRGTTSVPRGVKPERARSRNATAIVAVRLSMSTAPRPQTRRRRSRRRTDRAASRRGSPARRRCGPSAAASARSGSLPSMRATRFSRPGCAVVALEVETGVAEVLREHVGAAALEPRLRRAVVDARVADQVRRADRPTRSRSSASVAVTTDAGHDCGFDPVVRACRFSSHRSAIAGVHQVLEVGERLALGHRAPVPLREHLVRELDDGRRTERERRRRAACSMRSA